MLCKCSGKYIDIYSILKITCCRLAWPHHPALVTFGLRDIRVPVGLSISSLSDLGSGSSVFLCLTQFLGCTVLIVSLTSDSSHLFWMVATVAWFLASSSCTSSFGMSDLGCWWPVCLIPRLS